jgi:hypothetical protein
VADFASPAETGSTRHPRSTSGEMNRPGVAVLPYPLRRALMRNLAVPVLEVDGSISCLKYDEIKPDANTHLARRRFIQKK